MTQTPPEIFDHKRWVRQRDKAAAGFADFAFLKELATERLIERLQIVRRQFVNILDIIQARWPHISNARSVDRHSSDTG